MDLNHANTVLETGCHTNEVEYFGSFTTFRLLVFLCCPFQRNPVYCSGFQGYRFQAQQSFFGLTELPQLVRSLFSDTVLGSDHLKSSCLIQVAMLIHNQLCVVRLPLTLQCIARISLFRVAHSLDFVRTILSGKFKFEMSVGSLHPQLPHKRYLALIPSGVLSLLN